MKYKRKLIKEKMAALKDEKKNLKEQLSLLD